MSIDGLPVLLLAIAITVAAFVGAALLMGVLGRSFWAFALRILIMGLVSALVVVTGGIYANRTFHFYSDWADLFGTSTTAAPTEQSGGGATNAVDQQVPSTGRPTSAPTATRPALPSPGQRSQTYQVAGAASKLTGRVLVLLPQGYEDPANAGRLYPVIMALHGSPGNPEQYLSGGIDLAAELDKKVAAGTSSPAIVVAPVISFPGGVDTECVNGRAGQPQVETYLSRDLPDFIVANLRAKSARSAWNVFGFSTGGYCAAMLSILHPDVFATAIVLGGYFTPNFETPSYKPFGSNDPEWKERYDLLSYVKRSPPPVAMWVETSRSDPISYGTSEPFLAAVKPPLSVVSKIQDGGHRVEVWAAVTPTALDWLAATSRDFRA